jgi:hypothetical protein
MNQNLPIFDVPENLKNYATSKKDIKGSTEKMPPDNYRNKDEDIYEPIGSGSPQGSFSNKSTQGSSASDVEDDLSTMNQKPTFAKNGDTNVSLADF